MKNGQCLFTTIYAAVAVCQVINRLAGEGENQVGQRHSARRQVCILTESISDFESGMVETVI